MNMILAFSEDEALPAAAASSTDPSTAFSWGPLIGTLIVFFLLLFLAVYVIRRLNKRDMRGMNAPWMRVLDRQALGNRQVLYLVEIAGQLQVLGVTEQQMVKIAEINDPEVAAEILEEIANRPQERISGFLTDVSGKWLNRNKKGHDFSQELEDLLEEAEKR